jgi:hypothetical protein
MGEEKQQRVEKNEGPRHPLKANDSERRIVMKRNEHGSTLAGLTGRPKYVSDRPGVDPAARDEEVIGKAVHVKQNDGVYLLRAARTESDDEPFGAPANGSAKMKMSGGGMAARENKGAQRLKSGVQGIDLGFEARDLGRNQAKGGAAMSFRRLRQAEVGADVEQLVLDTGKHSIERGKFRLGGVESRQADSSIGFIHRAEGLDAQVRL